MDRNQQDRKKEREREREREREKERERQLLIAPSPSVPRAAGSPISGVPQPAAVAMEGELAQMQGTGAWQQLLRVIDEHTKDVQQTLAVHASRCSQPQHEPALASSLEAAGLKDAHVTGSGAWEVSLDLPSLFDPDDDAAFHVIVLGDSKEGVRRELAMSKTTTIAMRIVSTTDCYIFSYLHDCYIYYFLLHQLLRLLHLLLLLLRS